MIWGYKLLKTLFCYKHTSTPQYRVKTERDFLGKIGNEQSIIVVTFQKEI
jgi:hypothetical protein